MPGARGLWTYLDGNPQYGRYNKLFDYHHTVEQLSKAADLHPLNLIGMALHPIVIHRTKVGLGLVEGANNKIRALQRRDYGYCDEEFLKLKIISVFLPPLPRNANINPHVSALTLFYPELGIKGFSLRGLIF